MYKVCIFDLDGTLTDTLDSLVFSVNGSLNEMGLPSITRAQCQSFVGNGAKVLMERALQVVGCKVDENIEEAMKWYGRIFDENCTYHVTPYEGIPTLLDELERCGMKLAVLSNKPDSQTKRVVEEVFGKHRFHFVQGQKEGIPHKPDPGVALQIATVLGSEPETTLYIGDSEVDIATGAAANMRTIGVSWGFRNRECLIAAGATDIVDDPNEILKLIKEKKGNRYE